MWPEIIAASIVVLLMRMVPAFAVNFGKLSLRRQKVLDYTICLITGELIYTIAYNPAANPSNSNVALITCTLLIATVLMSWSKRLSLSLLVSLLFYMIAYVLLP